MNKYITNFLIILGLIICPLNVSAEILKKIEISGNKRISNETIKVYGDIQQNKNYQNEDINNVIKKLYETNLFKYFNKFQ